MPGTTIDKEVEALWGVGRNDPCKPEVITLGESLNEAGSETCGATNGVLRDDRAAATTYVSGARTWLHLSRV